MKGVRKTDVIFLERRVVEFILQFCHVNKELMFRQALLMSFEYLTDLAIKNLQIFFFFFFFFCDFAILQICYEGLLRPFEIV